MQQDYNVEKIAFYRRIRRLPYFKNPEAEYRVKELLEDMLKYQAHANKANCFINDMSGKTCQQVSAGEYSKYGGAETNNCFEPLHAKFEDLAHIATVVSISEETLGCFARHLDTGHDYLERIVCQYKDYAKNSLPFGLIDKRFFDPELLGNICTASDFKANPYLKKQSLKNISARCKDYNSRAFALNRLHDMRNNIHKFYLYERLLQKKNPRASVAKTNKKLGFRKTKRIAGYFKQQANLCSLRFDILSRLFTELTEREWPEFNHYAFL